MRDLKIIFDDFSTLLNALVDILESVLATARQQGSVQLAGAKGLLV